MLNHIGKNKVGENKRANNTNRQVQILTGIPDSVEPLRSGRINPLLTIAEVKKSIGPRPWNGCVFPSHQIIHCPPKIAKYNGPVSLTLRQFEALNNMESGFLIVLDLMRIKPEIQLFDVLPFIGKKLVGLICTEKQLQTCGVPITPDTFPCLKILQLHDCGSNAPIVDLSALTHLEQLGIISLWGHQIPNLPNKLNVLSIHHALSIQSLSQLPPLLKKIKLSNFPLLKSISYEGLTELEELNMFGVPELEGVLPLSKKLKVIGLSR